jgi:hypothetical protein
MPKGKYCVFRRVNVPQQIEWFPMMQFYSIQKTPPLIVHRNLSVCLYGNNVEHAEHICTCTTRNFFRCWKKQDWRQFFVWKGVSGEKVMVFFHARKTNLDIMQELFFSPYVHIYNGFWLELKTIFLCLENEKRIWRTSRFRKTEEKNNEKLFKMRKNDLKIIKVLKSLRENLCVCSLLILCSVDRFLDRKKGF